MDKYETFLIDYISEHSGLEYSYIDTDVDMFENNYIDSIGIFTLLIEIENKFSKEITLEDISSLEKYNIKNISKLMI